MSMAYARVAASAPGWADTSSKHTVTRGPGVVQPLQLRLACGDAMEVAR